MTTAAPETRFYLRHPDGRDDGNTAAWYATIDDAGIDRAVAIEEGAKAAALVVVDAAGQNVTGTDPVLISYCECGQQLWVYASEAPLPIDRNDAPHVLRDGKDRCRKCADDFVPDDGPPEWMFDEAREHGR